MKQITIQAEKRGYQIEEAYKSLRTNLQFCGEDKRVIAVTSCTPNEGKSSVSLQLAMSLAESGKNTLLIDADLRKSVFMGKVCENKQTIYGLTHFLSAQRTLQEITCSTNIKNLYTILSGPFPPNPAELLGSKSFEKLLYALRDVYEYIIIDTPPLGSVIDCAIVSEVCDGVIIVLEAEATSYRFAREVKEQLEKGKCPILGVVLNKVAVQKQGYGKYGKYGKYYAKYYGKSPQTGSK